MWAQSLHPAWTPHLASVESVQRYPDGLRAWILDTRAAHTVQQTPSENRFVIHAANAQWVAEGFASEISRFSIAAAESTFSIADSALIPRTRAWQFIQWYYAAFYSAHALLRSFGSSLIFLERGHAAHLNSLARSFGHPDPGVSRGYFLVRFPHGQDVEFERVNVDGGSHDALWRQFAVLVADLSTRVLSFNNVPTVDQQQVSSDLDSLVAQLRTQPYNNGTWLSGMRNDITYRHLPPTWFPWSSQHHNPIATLALRTGRVLPSDPQPELQDAVAHQGTLQAFHRLCKCVVAFNRSTYVEVANRAGTRASFHRNGALKLDNHVIATRPSPRVRVQAGNRRR